MPTRRGLLLGALGLVPAGMGSRAVVLPPLPFTRILFGGDVMMSRYVGLFAARQRDPALPFRKIAPLLAAADIAFVNLEAPFSNRGHRFNPGIVFRAAPETIEGLRLAGIDVVSTANNHARDCGEPGIEFTLDWLAFHGIAAAGTGHSAEQAHQGAVLTRNGVRFGFLAYTYDQKNGNYTDEDARIAMLDIPAMRADVGKLLERADVAVVSMHAGDEYRSAPNSKQREFAHAAIDAGAQVVVGHHPHVIQTVEDYRRGVIFYSLGNLVFDQFQRRDTQRGLLAETVFLGKRLARYSTIPVDIVGAAPQLAKGTDENGVGALGGRHVRGLPGGRVAGPR
jgi:poly-gamma-glutamate synthesis protein (capsule biosynthesis protein)